VWVKKSAASGTFTGEAQNSGQNFSQRRPVKVKFALEQAMKAQTGSRCIALLLLSP